MDKTDKEAKNHNRFIAMPGINRFSERLQIAMQGMTNVALAAKCGISESAVRSYLKGKSFPAIDKIQSIAEACSAPMIWLIVGESIAENDAKIAIYDEPGLGAVLHIMTNEQKRILARAIIEHGILGTINALKGMSAVSDFMLLPEVERARVLRIYEQIKEGASHGDQDAAQRSLMTGGKQAG